MTLTHTQYAGYIERNDEYTDDFGVTYAVWQDIDAEDPRSWLTNEEAAVVVIKADHHTRTDNIYQYIDNPAIDDLVNAMEQDDIDHPDGITNQWWDAWKRSFAQRNSDYDVEMMTCQIDQSSWFTVVAAVKNGYGSALSHIEIFETWARGNVWVVSPDYPGYDTLCGIYADDPREAVERYIEDYRPYDAPYQDTLF